MNPYLGHCNRGERSQLRADLTGRRSRWQQLSLCQFGIRYAVALDICEMIMECYPYKVIRGTWVRQRKQGTDYEMAMELLGQLQRGMCTGWDHFYDAMFEDKLKDTTCSLQMWSQRSNDIIEKLGVHEPLCWFQGDSAFGRVIQRIGGWWSSLSRSKGSMKGNGRGGKGRGGGYGYQSHSPSPFSTFSKAMEDAQSLTNMMRFAAALQPGLTPGNSTTASTVSPWAWSAPGGVGMTAAIGPGGLAATPVSSTADPVTQVLHAALAGGTSGGQQTSSPQKGVSGH